MNFIDNLVAVFNPQKGVERFKARRKLEILNTGYSNHGASTTKKAMIVCRKNKIAPCQDK